MNFIRNKFSKLRTAFQQGPVKDKKKESYSSQVAHSVYQQLKKWDQDRAELLRKHLCVVERIIQQIKYRLVSSREYPEKLLVLFQNRIKELKKYTENCLSNSSFILSNNKNLQRTYGNSYQLLKQFTLYDASKTQNSFQRKLNKLTTIYQQFSKNIREYFGEQLEEGCLKNQCEEIFVDLRYLLDCQLPEKGQSTFKCCEQINKTYKALQKTQTSVEFDLYLLIESFLTCSEIQLEKHNQVNQQLFRSVKRIVDNEQQLNRMIRAFVRKWMNAEQSLKNLEVAQNQKLEELPQLKSTKGQIEIIQTQVTKHYNFSEILNNMSSQFEFDLAEFFNTCVENPLIVKSFSSHQEKLLKFKTECFYNKKLQIQVLISVENHCHLKKPHYSKVQFSFCLQNNNITVVEEDRKNQNTASFKFFQSEGQPMQQGYQKQLKETEQNEKKFQFWLEFDKKTNEEALDQLKYILKCIEGLQYIQ